MQCSSHWSNRLGTPWLIGTVQMHWKSMQLTILKLLLMACMSRCVLFRQQPCLKAPQVCCAQTEIQLGQGAFKSVFEGFDTDKCRSVAWSEVLTADMDEEERGKVHREAELLKQLSHPCLLDCFAVWHTDTKLVIITELKKAGDLQEFTRSNRPKLKVIKRWLRDVLEGLVYLHSQSPPVAHRDIKAQNIFYDSAKGQLCIGDLGLAAQLPPGSSQRVKFTGTPQFMAPELFGLKYDERVDVYAVGMLALQLVTGRLPYCECDNEAHVFGKVSKQQLPEAWEHIKYPSIREFIKDCCFLQQGQQRPSAAAIMQHPFLASVGSGEEGPPSSPGGGVYPPPEDEEDELMQPGWEPPVPDSKRQCDGGGFSSGTSGAGPAAVAMGAGETERVSGEGDSDDSDDSDDSKRAGWMEGSDDEEYERDTVASAGPSAVHNLSLKVPPPSTRQSRSHTPAIVAASRGPATKATAMLRADTEGSVVTPGVAGAAQRVALPAPEMMGSPGSDGGGTASEGGDSVRDLDDRQFGGSSGRKLRRSGSAPGLHRLVGSVSFGEADAVRVDTAPRSVGGGGDFSPQRSLPLTTTAAHSRANSIGDGVKSWGVLRSMQSMRGGGKTPLGGSSRFDTLAEGHEIGKGRHRARAFNENRRNLQVSIASPPANRSMSLPRREPGGLLAVPTEAEPLSQTPSRTTSADESPYPYHPGMSDQGGTGEMAGVRVQYDEVVEAPLLPVAGGGAPESPQYSELHPALFDGALTPYGHRVAAQWYLPGAATAGELNMVMRLRYRPLSPESMADIQAALEEKRAHLSPEFHTAPAVPVVTVTGGVKLCLEESPEAAAQGLLDMLAVGVPAAYSAHPAALHLLSSAIAALQVCPDATLTVGPVPAWGWVSFALGTQAHTEARFDMEMAAEEADMQQAAPAAVQHSHAPSAAAGGPGLPPPHVGSPPPSSHSAVLDGGAISESPSESSEQHADTMVRPGPMSPHSHCESGSMAGTPVVAALTSPLVGSVVATYDGGTGGLAGAIRERQRESMEPLPPSAMGNEADAEQSDPRRPPHSASSRASMGGGSSSTGMQSLSQSASPIQHTAHAAQAARRMPRMQLAREDSAALDSLPGEEAFPGEHPLTGHVAGNSSASTPVTQAEDDFTPYPYDNDELGDLSPRAGSPVHGAPAGVGAWAAAGKGGVSSSSDKHDVTPRATQSGLPGAPHSSGGQRKKITRTLSSSSLVTPKAEGGGGRNLSSGSLAVHKAGGGGRSSMAIEGFSLLEPRAGARSGKLPPATLQDLLGGAPKATPVTQSANRGGGLWQNRHTTPSSLPAAPLAGIPIQQNGGGISVHTAAPSSQVISNMVGGGHWGGMSAQRSSSGLSSVAGLPPHTPTRGNVFATGTPSMAMYASQGGQQHPVRSNTGSFTPMGGAGGAANQPMAFNGTTAAPQKDGGLAMFGYGDTVLSHMGGGGQQTTMTTMQSAPHLNGGGQQTNMQPPQSHFGGLNALEKEMQAGGGQMGAPGSQGPAVQQGSLAVRGGRF